MVSVQRSPTAEASNTAEACKVVGHTQREGGNSDEDDARYESMDGGMPVIPDLCARIQIDPV